MCKRLNSSMVVRCALREHECISYGELLDIRNKLIHVGGGYLVDISFRSVSRAVNTYGDELEIIAGHDEFSVRRRNRRRRTNLFDYEHLEKCYMEFFPKRDRCAIVSIISRKKSGCKS